MAHTARERHVRALHARGSRVIRLSVSPVMAGHQRQADQDYTDAHHVDHHGIAPSTSPDGDGQELRRAWKVPKIIVSPGVYL